MITLPTVRSTLKDYLEHKNKNWSNDWTFLGHRPQLILSSRSTALTSMYRGRSNSKSSPLLKEHSNLISKNKKHKNKSPTELLVQVSVYDWNVAFHDRYTNTSRASGINSKALINGKESLFIFTRR